MRVEFSIGEKKISVTRNFFEVEALRELNILDGSSPIALDEFTSEQSLNEFYEEKIAEAVGLDTFAQFVFLQHFVFTFDEGRHLLFWEPRALEQALFLSFGVDVKVAQKADLLRREADKADSRARNFNWQATQTRAKLQDIEDAISIQDTPGRGLEDLRKYHETLVDAAERAEKAFHDNARQLSDAELLFATTSAELATAREAYQAEYTTFLRDARQVSQHPVISSLLHGNACEVCGAKTDAASAAVKKKLSLHHCPVCDSDIPTVAVRPTQSLLALDKKMVELNRILQEVSRKKERLLEQHKSLEAFSLKADQAVTKFESDNASSLRRLSTVKEGSGVDTAITRYKEQIDELLLRKRQEYSRRDEIRKQLRVLQKGLMAKYEEGEEVFAPQFRELAKLFLGLDLDIRLETAGGAGAGLGLALEVKSTVRRETYQLSESQRFFVDIALRMALLQFMSGNKSGALLIDTPEGSLDIAYENRAGVMFAAFVKKGFCLVMTANINTSRLLLALAEQCGTALMTLCRMTTWTDLSEVQSAEEKRFAEAFDSILKAQKMSETAGSKRRR